MIHTHTNLILPSHPFPREQTHYKCQVNAITFLLHVHTGKKKNPTGIALLVCMHICMALLFFLSDHASVTHGSNDKGVQN